MHSSIPGLDDRMVVLVGEGGVAGGSDVACKIIFIWTIYFTLSNSLFVLLVLAQMVSGIYVFSSFKTFITTVEQTYCKSS